MTMASRAGTIRAKPSPWSRRHVYMPTRESKPNRDKAVASGARGRPDGGADGAPPGGGADPDAAEQGSAPIAVRLVLWGSGALLALVVVVGVGIGISAA